MESCNVYNCFRKNAERMISMLKQNKGVTLVALIITVTILLILASISIVSGTAAVSYIKFTNAKSQISTIQTNVNSWYQEAQNNTEILNYGQEVNETNCDSQKLQDTENHVGNLNQYRYFSADYLKNDLDIDGISYDFLIDIENRSVILFGGITYEDINYFTAQEFGIENVEYQDMSGNITFDTNIENGYIVVSNIQMPENISKYNVEYQLNGTDMWKFKI